MIRKYTIIFGLLAWHQGFLFGGEIVGLAVYRNKACTSDVILASEIYGGPVNGACQSSFFRDEVQKLNAHDIDASVNFASLEDIRRSAEQIQAFNDGPILNEFYRKTFTGLQALYGQCAQQCGSIFDLAQVLRGQKQTSTYKNLVASMLVHRILNDQREGPKVVRAAALLISGLEPLLQAIGYTCLAKAPSGKRC